MLGICCSDGARCRTGPECCEEKLEDALSRLSFDEIKHLIHAQSSYIDENSPFFSARCENSSREGEALEQSRGGEAMTGAHAPLADSSSCCCGSETGGLLPRTAAEAFAVSAPAGSEVHSVDSIQGAPVQVGRLPSKVSSWRRKQLEASSYLRAEAQLEDTGKEDIMYSGDEVVGPLNMRALETAAAATAYAGSFSARTASTEQGPSPPFSARASASESGRQSSHKELPGTAFLDSLSDDVLEKALALGKVVGPTASDPCARDWSIDSEEQGPGPISKSHQTPAMGASIIEHGYKFDTDGFHEVGSLDDADEMRGRFHVEHPITQLPSVSGSIWLG